jgi:hypothetical protein
VLANVVLIPSQKLITMLPRIEAALVKCCVRILKKWIARIADEMLCADNLIIRLDDFAAEQTLGFAS